MKHVLQPDLTPSNITQQIENWIVEANHGAPTTDRDRAVAYRVALGWIEHMRRDNADMWIQLTEGGKRR